MSDRKINDEPRASPIRSAIGVLLVVGVASILVGCDGPDPPPSHPPPTVPVATVATSTVATTAASPPPVEVTVAPIALQEAIPLRVLAIAGSSLAVVDLEDRVTTVYPPGTHALPDGPNDGAVMTPTRRWITWNDGLARLTSGRFDETPVELGPTARRMIPGIAPALRVVPTPDGRRAWLVQPGRGYGDNDDPTLIELISLAGGEAITSLEVDADAFPVAATAGGLVVTTNRWSDTGDGFVTAPGSETVLHLHADGAPVPVGEGVAIAASSTRIVRLGCPPDAPGCDLHHGENRLIVSDPDGEEPIEVAPPFIGRWQSVGGPGIPSEAMPLQTVSPDGSTLLVSLGRNLDANTVPADAVLLTVDLDTGATRTIAEIEPKPTPLATWSADGRWVALLGLNDIHLINANDPTTTITLDDVIPSDHFPLAAG